MTSALSPQLTPLPRQKSTSCVCTCTWGGRCPASRPLQHPSMAHDFRLTWNGVWSTDTPSSTRVSGAGVRFLSTCDPTAPTAVLEGAAMRCLRDESEHPTGTEFCGECVIPLTGLEPVLPPRIPSHCSATPTACGREKAHLHACAGRRTHTGDGAVCWSERLHGVTDRLQRLRGLSRSRCSARSRRSADR